MSKSSSIIPARQVTADAGKALPSIPPRSSSGKRETIALTRDVDALRVPTGDHATLPEGSEVTLFQALGGSFSVEFAGQLFRIDGTEADALGKEPLTLDFDNVEPGVVREEHVEKVLRTVYDPEIPVNIVDLGLVYEQRIEGSDVTIHMTLTAPACGMGEVLCAEVAQRLKRVPNIGNVKVKLVFDPPWDRSMLSEVAKLELGMI